MATKTIFGTPETRKLSLKEGGLQKKHQLFIFISSITLALSSFHSKANAQGGLFGGAESAMDCVVQNAAGGSGITNALITELPGIIFSVITVIIFAYILVSLIKIFQAVQRGEEATTLIVPPLTVLAGLAVIGVVQSVLFGSSGGC